MHSIAIGGTLFLLGAYLSPVHPPDPCKARDMTNDRPDDLTIVGTSGGLLPGSVNYVVEIGPNGSGRFTRYRPDDLGPPLETATFVIAEAQLDSLWSTIVHIDFFSLEPRYENPTVADGAFASVTITAHGRTHQVDVRNISTPRFQKLLAAINRFTPDGMDLVYSIDTGDA